MKAVKLFLAGFAFAAVLFGTAVNAYAATNDDVINTLKAANVDSVYVTKAENYLKSANLSATQLDTINQEVKVVADILKSENTTDVTKLTKANKLKVMDAIKQAATAANLTVTFGKDSKGLSYVSLTDSTGAEVFRATANDNGMKVTGTNYTVLLSVGSMLVLVSLALFAVRKRPAANSL